MKKACFIFTAACLIALLSAGTILAVNKTMQINIQGCWT